MDRERPDRVNFRYTKGSDYRVVPAVGAYGGPTPDGQIMANFYVEHSELPETSAQAVEPDGTLGDVIPPTKRDEEGVWFERHLTVGVLMPADKARRIGKWLVEKVEELEKAQAEAREEE